MNLQTLAEYVEQEVDDNFSTADITRWFNKSISQYNLLPPLTTYPLVVIDEIATSENGLYDETTPYPLPDTFMLAVMLPLISSSIRGSESAIQERQIHFADFLRNAASFKRSIDIPLSFLLNKKNEDLSNFEIGEGVFLGDFTRSPFAGEWQRPSIFSEITISEDEE